MNANANVNETVDYIAVMHRMNLHSAHILDHTHPAHMAVNLSVKLQLPLLLLLLLLLKFMRYICMVYNVISFIVATEKKNEFRNS